MNPKVLALALLAFALSACGSRSVVRQALPLDPAAPAHAYVIESVTDATDEVPAEYSATIWNKLNAELARAGLAAGDGRPGHAVRVVLNGYRMRSDFTRFMFGILAGTDKLESLVSVVDGETGAVLGESEISSFNASALGSAGLIANLYAAKVKDFLLGKNDPPKEKKAVRPGREF